MKNNPFYNLKSTKKLFNLLFIENINFLNEYNVYIDKNNRIIEQPIGQLATVQKRVYDLLKRSDLPEYIFSSKKGFNYYDNAAVHVKNNYIVTLDISKFFPRSNSKYIQMFFLNEMKTSKDVANILMKICSINLDKLNLKSKVIQWIDNTNSKLKYPIQSNHIPTGSSISQLMAFYAYKRMFDEIHQLCKSNNILMTLFVDDITISCKTKISNNVIYEIKNIIKNYGLEINKSKIKKYNIDHIPAKITGVIINKKHETRATTKLHHDLYILIKEFKINPTVSNRNKLFGKLASINQIENNQNYAVKIKKLVKSKQL